MLIDVIKRMYDHAILEIYNLIEVLCNFHP